MNTILFYTFYALIAAAVSAYVFIVGVLRAPRVDVFAPSDYGILTVTSVVVGALWLLFTPLVLTAALIRLARALRTRSGGWAVTRSQPARAGS